MDPQHLARLDDDGSVRRISTGTAGGSSATRSPEGHEVPASAPVQPLDATGARRTGRSRTLARSGSTIVLRPDAGSDAWPLPVESDGLLLTDAWPLLDVDALQRAGAVDGGSVGPRAEQRSDAQALTAEEVVADVAAGSGPRNRRRPFIRGRRPALYLAAALIGAAGVAVTASSDPARTAQADEPVSVAEELGLVQTDQSLLSGDEATSRLQQLVATRAEREDAQAAAADIQAEADRAAVAAVAAAAAAAAAAAEEAARPTAVLPVQGARLSSGFGYRWGTQHAGVDFAAPLGTPEHAAMDGVVVRAGAASGFGLAVYVQHANGDVTVYGHMEQILVEEGQTVKAGDTIALLGNRGQSTGPHLHFEVHVGGIDGQKIDPLPWLRERGVTV
jgi:murein DD-endopeptidase MepM/ murein hydrolase activator NlpD